MILNFFFLNDPVWFDFPCRIQILVSSQSSEDCEFLVYQMNYIKVFIFVFESEYTVKLVVTGFIADDSSSFVV